MLQSPLTVGDFRSLNDTVVDRSECSRNLLQGFEADAAQGTMRCTCQSVDLLSVNLNVYNDIVNYFYTLLMWAQNPNR